MQDAILPSNKLMESIFDDFSIYFRPKDTVSGDFYWFETTPGYVYFAIADCTGHGVPRDLVSVVGHNALNKCINELKLTDPGEILDNLTILVEHTFNKTHNVVNDGMDIAFCRWIYKDELLYAGAFNPLYILRNDAFIEYKANRQPIGKFIRRTAFRTHKIKIEINDQIFVFSDGYVDHFGGDRGKKLKSKAFKQIIHGSAKKTTIYFNKNLDQSFKEWTVNEEQIDDICILRVRF